MDAPQLTTAGTDGLDEEVGCSSAWFQTPDFGRLVMNLWTEVKNFTAEWKKSKRQQTAGSEL